MFGYFVNKKLYMNELLTIFTDFLQLLFVILYLNLIPIDVLDFFSSLGNAAQTIAYN